jgi:chromosome transmission fidelity protein 1
MGKLGVCAHVLIMCVCTFSLRYLLLNAACTFAPVVRECRAVILAGGTMEPSEPLRASLHDECALPVNHLDRFACSHIVDPSHIRPLIVMRGAVSEAPLNLAFK